MPYRFGVLRDHSPVEWPGEALTEEFERDATARGRVTTSDGRCFRPTIWQQAGGRAVLILLEEEH